MQYVCAFGWVGLRSWVLLSTVLLLLFPRGCFWNLFCFVALRVGTVGGDFLELGVEVDAFSRIEEQLAIVDSARFIASGTMCCYHVVRAKIQNYELLQLRPVCTADFVFVVEGMHEVLRERYFRAPSEECKLTCISRIV